MDVANRPTVATPPVDPNVDVAEWRLRSLISYLVDVLPPDGGRGGPLSEAPWGLAAYATGLLKLAVPNTGSLEGDRRARRMALFAWLADVAPPTESELRAMHGDR